MLADLEKAFPSPRYQHHSQSGQNAACAGGEMRDNPWDRATGWHAGSWSCFQELLLEAWALTRGVTDAWAHSLKPFQSEGGDLFSPLVSVLGETRGALTDDKQGVLIPFGHCSTLRFTAGAVILSTAFFNVVAQSVPLDGTGGLLVLSGVRVSAPLMLLSE